MCNINKEGINMRKDEKMTIAQNLITEFVPTMDYVSGPTSKWRGLYIISTKIGINTWLYLKTENGFKFGIFLYEGMFRDETVTWLVWAATTYHIYIHIKSCPFFNFDLVVDPLTEPSLDSFSRVPRGAQQLGHVAPYYRLT
jgi:hypothetical protein